jgi:hypothetical protein
MAPNNDSYSPPMAPNNDSYSPPMAPTTTGFNMNVGDIVYFRGDNLVGRIWKIRNIGDRFITIETENLQGIEDKDSIKVVTEMDIYRPEDFAYSERNAEPITGVNHLMNGGGHVQKPNINVHFGVDGISLLMVILLCGMVRQHLLLRPQECRYWLRVIPKHYLKDLLNHS